MGKSVSFLNVTFKREKGRTQRKDQGSLDRCAKKKKKTTSFAVKFFKQRRHHPAVSWPHLSSILIQRQSRFLQIHLPAVQLVEVSCDFYCINFPDKIVVAFFLLKHVNRSVMSDFCDHNELCVAHPEYRSENTGVVSSFLLQGVTDPWINQCLCPGRWVLHRLSLECRLTLVACFSHGFTCNVPFLLLLIQSPWFPSPLKFLMPTLSPWQACLPVLSFSLCPLSVLFSFLQPQEHESPHRFHLRPVKSAVFSC